MNIYTIVVCTQNAAKLPPSFIHEDDVPIIMYPDISFRDQVVNGLKSQIKFYRQKKVGSPYPEEPLRKVSSQEQDEIQRSIEFSPEHQQAGIAILNYFGKIIKQKYPDIPVKIRIEHEDLTVRMLIETKEGFKETIERNLAEYGLVVLGKMQPEEFLSDPAHVMELKHKLEMARMEVKHAWEMKQLAETAKEERIQSLESEVGHLRSLVGKILSQSDDKMDLLQFVVQQIAVQQDTAVTQALNFVKTKLEVGVAEAEMAEVEEQLSVIKKHAPSVFKGLPNIGTSAVAGASGNLIFQALQKMM